MTLTQQYIETFENKTEIKNAILLRRTIMRNAINMPKQMEDTLEDEIEQFKRHYLKLFNEEFE